MAPEQVIPKLRQVHGLVGQQATAVDACRLVGLAAFLDAGISAAIAGVLADDGKPSGRGTPLPLRGLVCGLITIAVRHRRTIPNLYEATIVAAIAVAFEMLAID